MKPVLVVGGMLAAAVLLFVATIVATNRRSATTTRLRPPASRRRCPWTTRAPPAGDGEGQSFAGAAPDNAAELAKAHKPYPAALPPLTPGDVVKVHMVLKDVTIEIAPA